MNKHSVIMMMLLAFGVQNAQGSTEDLAKLAGSLFTLGGLYYLADAAYQEICNDAVTKERMEKLPSHRQIQIKIEDALTRGKEQVQLAPDELLVFDSHNNLGTLVRNVKREIRLTINNDLLKAVWCSIFAGWCFPKK